MDSPYKTPVTPVEDVLSYKPSRLVPRIIAFVFGMAGLLGAVGSLRILLNFVELREQLGVTVSLANWAIPGALSGVAGLAAIACSILARPNRWLRALSLSSLLFAVAAILITPIAGYYVRDAGRRSHLRPN